MVPQRSPSCPADLFSKRYLNAQKKNQKIRAALYLTLSGFYEEGIRFVFQEGLTLAVMSVVVFVPSAIGMWLFGFALTDLAPPLVIVSLFVRGFATDGYSWIFAFRFHPQVIVGHSHKFSDDADVGGKNLGACKSKFLFSRYGPVSSVWRRTLFLG